MDSPTSSPGCHLYAGVANAPSSLLSSRQIERELKHKENMKWLLKEKEIIINCSRLLLTCVLIHSPVATQPPLCDLRLVCRQAYFCTPRYLPTSLGTFPGSRGNLLPLRTLPRPTYIGQARLGPVWGYPSQTPSWVSDVSPTPPQTGYPWGTRFGVGWGMGWAGSARAPGPNNGSGGGGGTHPHPVWGTPNRPPPQTPVWGVWGGSGWGPLGAPKPAPPGPPPTPPRPRFWGFSQKVVLFGVRKGGLIISPVLWVPVYTLFGLDQNPTFGQNTGFPRLLGQTPVLGTFGGLGAPKPAPPGLGVQGGVRGGGPQGPPNRPPHPKPAPPGLGVQGGGPGWGPPGAPKPAPPRFGVPGGVRVGAPGGPQTGPPPGTPNQP